LRGQGLFRFGDTSSGKGLGVGSRAWKYNGFYYKTGKNGATNQTRDFLPLHRQFRSTGKGSIGTQGIERRKGVKNGRAVGGKRGQRISSNRGRGWGVGGLCG